VITCLNNLDATLKQEYTKMQAERVAIQLTVTALEQAVAKKEELNELGRKAREDANDARLLQLMQKYGFHDVGSIGGRIIGEKRTADEAIRLARKNKLDALEHAVGVNTTSVNTVRHVLAQLAAAKENARVVADQRARVYAAKAQHMKDSMERIKAHKSEMKRQRDAVVAERQQAAELYVEKIDQWKRDSELKLAKVKELLKGIEENEAAVRNATRDDIASAWKAKVLQGVADENDRVLNGCYAEIAEAPEKLIRCSVDTTSMGQAATQLLTSLETNLHRDDARRKSAGLELDVDHWEEHTVARKTVFAEKLRVDVKHFNCDQEIKSAEAKMEDASDLGDDDVYAEEDEKRASKQAQRDRHEHDRTSLLCEIDDLDQLIARVTDRLQPLYADAQLQEGACTPAHGLDVVFDACVLRARIDDTPTNVPWSRIMRGPGVGMLQKELPAYELERQERERMKRLLDRREQALVERLQAAADEQHQFARRIMGEIADVPGGGGAGGGATYAAAAARGATGKPGGAAAAS
jgi:hypothetical protein